jgi:hypothetical protein
MATNTYVALDKKTISTAVSTIEFTSIPQGYTDLIIIAKPKTTETSYLNMRLNSDTGSNYSRTTLSGSGSTVSSERRSNQTQGFTDYNESISTNFNYINILHFMNYANTTTYKTILCRAGTADGGSGSTVVLWRSTSAITTIQLRSNAGNFDVGSTFSLYGIAAASVGAKATGGVISSDDNYWYHTFYNSGTFTPSQSLSAQVLAVGGGGGGGGNIGAGGGAGAMTTFNTTSSLSSGVAYTCTVGASAPGGSGSANGTQGNTTSFAGSGFTTITALGGGRGPQSGSGFAGGSGSGGAPQNPSSTPGSASGPNTNAGGIGYYTYPYYAAGGGGGATAVGGNGTSGASFGGNGGAGYTISNIDSALPNTKIFGSMTVIASGGGGSGVRPDGSGAPQTGGTGGTGAGNGGFSTTNATSATSYGSGGGGGTWTNFSTGNGGSGQQGIIVVRYAKA